MTKEDQSHPPLTPGLQDDSDNDNDKDDNEDLQPPPNLNVLVAVTFLFHDYDYLTSSGEELYTAGVSESGEEKASCSHSYGVNEDPHYSHRGDQFGLLWRALSFFNIATENVPDANRYQMAMVMSAPEKGNKGNIEEGVMMATQIFNPLSGRLSLRHVQPQEEVPRTSADCPGFEDGTLGDL